MDVIFSAFFRFLTFRIKCNVFLNSGYAVNNIPKYYNSGLRRCQIIHTRLRIGCSSLNYDLFLENILVNPLCRLNSGSVKNAQHFLLNCRLYREQTIELYTTLSLSIVILLWMCFCALTNRFPLKQMSLYLKLYTSISSLVNAFKYLLLCLQ